MSVQLSPPLVGVHAFHHAGKHPHLRDTRCLGQVPSPPSCRPAPPHRGVTGRVSRHRRHLGRRAERALAQPGPAGASPRQAAGRGSQGAAPERSAAAGAGRQQHHRLLLWQDFQRGFWLPLHFVRNLITSARMVCPGQVYRRALGECTGVLWASVPACSWQEYDIEPMGPQQLWLERGQQ